jgi:hypothetical protein
MSLLQAARNQAIAQVQQIEAAIQLLEGEPDAVKPSCRQCQSTDLAFTIAGGRKLAICGDCNHNQPAE